MTETQPAKPDTTKRVYAMAGIFIFAFALAFALAWYLFGRQGGTDTDERASTRVLTGADVKEFFAAAEARDFQAMSRLGRELFRTGTTVKDSKKVLADYETNSYPPHLVYVFYSDIVEDRVYRVLLTMDDEDKVVSFMAEDMVITK